MNALFLGVCGFSVRFFGFFLLACHRDASRRRSRTPNV